MEYSLVASRDWAWLKVKEPRSGLFSIGLSYCLANLGRKIVVSDVLYND